MPKLILFDLDGTIAEMTTGTILPGVPEWFAQNGWQHAIVVTNQGGVGLHHWMKSGKFGSPEEFPTEDSIQAHLTKVYNQLGFTLPTLVCYRYQSKKAPFRWCPIPAGCETVGEWREDWRKPAPGMLLEAMTLRGVKPEDTLMVGNGVEDKAAADAAGCAFQFANVFFGREPTVEDARAQYRVWLDGEYAEAEATHDADRMTRLQAEMKRIDEGETA